MIEEYDEIDTESKYIWECEDKEHEFWTTIKEKRTQEEWWPYLAQDAKWVQIFENAFQEYIKIRISNYCFKLKNNSKFTLFSL